MSPCPSPETIQQFISGTLLLDEVQTISSHIHDCSKCEAIVIDHGEQFTLLMYRAAWIAAGQNGHRNNQLDREVNRAMAVWKASPEATGATMPEDLSFLGEPLEPNEIARLGQYRILKRLGSGGMGIVFLAEDTILKRMVALKVLRPEIMSDLGAKKRFLKEAQAAARLKSDHVVVVYQVGEQDGVPFLAMEFLEGESLEQRFQRKKIASIEEVLNIGTQITDGLSAAHRSGLVHRDIKPANLWIEQSPQSALRVKILDFGLVRVLQNDDSISQSGVVVGTPNYMSPEQASGEIVDQRTDLFSLGCVMYRLATGHGAFQGWCFQSSLRAVIFEDPKPPVEWRSDLPQELSDLILKLLSKEPENRPQSADDVLSVLHELSLSTVDDSRHMSLDNGWHGTITIPPSNAATVTRRVEPRSVNPFASIGLVRTIAAAIVLIGLIATYQLSLPTAKTYPVAGRVSATTDEVGSATISQVPERTDAATANEKDENAAVVGSVEQPEPFVLLRESASERCFGTLMAAVAAAQNGDLIEIRGNDTYSCDKISLSPIRLRIRAGEGFRPRLAHGRPDKPADGYLLAGAGHLVLEGLDLELFTVPGTTASEILSQWGSLYVAHCRFVVHGPATAIHSNVPNLVVRNSEFLITEDAWHGIQWYSSKNAPGSRVHVDGCIFYTPRVPTSGTTSAIRVFVTRELKPFSIEISNSTFLTMHSLSMVFLNVDEQTTLSAGQFVGINLRNNIFANHLSVMNHTTRGDAILRADRIVAQSPRIFRWQQAANLFSDNAAIISEAILGAALDPPTPELLRLSPFEKWMNIDDSTSVQDSVEFAGISGNEQDLDAIRPEQMRLRNSHDRFSGQSFGAATELVGPGQPYDAWTKSSDYKLWLAQTGYKSPAH